MHESIEQWLVLMGQLGKGELCTIVTNIHIQFLFCSGAARVWIECTFIAELHCEKLAVQTCHKSCADSGSDTHVMLTYKFVTGGKSVNILGPINGLAMSNLGKANFGMAPLSFNTSSCFP